MVAQPRMCAGDRRLRRLREYLNMFKRTADQIRIHEEHFIPMCLPHIYKEDFEPNRLRLFKEFGLTSLKVGALELLPRRYGKTTCVGQFSAAMMMIGCRFTIATFAPGGRASSSLMTLTVQLLYQLPGGKERVIAKNEEQFLVATADQVHENGTLKFSKSTIKDSGNVNRLLAFPASSNGTVSFFPIVSLSRARAHTHAHMHTRPRQAGR